MISIQYQYAAYKVRTQGGELEDYVKEWKDKHKQSRDILEQRGLYNSNAKDALAEAGLVEEVPHEAHSYGIDSVVGFYERMKQPNTERRLWVANMFGICEKDVKLLEEKVKEKIGQDYLRINEQLHNFPRDSERKGALPPKDL